jgi:sodium/pantothenate symporter
MTPLTAVFIPVMVAYLLCLALLTCISYRKTDSLREFFVMGGSAGAFLTGSAYFATQFSMSSLLGVPGTLYNVGFAGHGIILSIAMFSMAFGVILAGRRLQRLSRESHLLTLPDYLASRYGSNAIRLLSALIVVVFLIPYMGAQVVGSGVIFQVFTGAPYWLGVVVMGTIVIAYCVLGGMRAAILSDALQGLVMVAAAVATFLAVARAGGGVSRIMSELAATSPGALSFPGEPVEYFSWRGYVSQILMWTLFSIGQPQLVNKYMAARNYASLVRGCLFSGGAIILTCLTIWTAGVMARVVRPGIDQPDWVIPTIMTTTMSPAVASILQTGILAAGMSTISSIVVMVAGALSRDIYQQFLCRDSTDERVLAMARLMTVVAGAIAIGLALLRPATIFQIVLFGWSGTGILAIPILLGLYWKRASAAGAIAGTACGLAILLLATFRFPSWALGFHPIVVASAAAAAVAAVISLSRARSPTPEEHFRIAPPVRDAASARYFVALGVLYFLVWLPVPWIFPWKQYLPGFLGIPVFIWVWVAIQIVAAGVLYLYLHRIPETEDA